MEKITHSKQLASLTENTWTSEASINGFSTDTRTIQPGQVFCAIRGERVDGHHFVEEALAKGASCALVEKDYKGKGALLVVDNVVGALKKAAENLLKSRDVKIAAITGSVGKTSTKEFLHTLLEKKFQVGKSIGNQNSQVGLPLTILNDTTGKEDILVLEMGMTHTGNIAQLVKIAPPDVALITQIALVHAENFSSIEGIFQAKKEIFSHSKTKLKITPFEWRSESTTFSLEERKADFFLDGNTLYEQGIAVGELPLNLPGKHYHHNLLGAIAAASYFGLSCEEIRERIPHLKRHKQRFELKEKQGILFIDDSYNASAIAIKAALNSLPSPKNGQFTFAVLGGMRELGKFSEQCHIDVAEEALKTVDYLFCYGSECLPMLDVWQKRKRPAFYFESHAALVQKLKSTVAAGDVVLVKGANSKQMWKIVDEF